MSRETRRLVVALVITFTAPLVAIAVWRLWFPGRPFDPVVWRDEAQTISSVRSEMADRLIARGTLLGKTRAEVVELLGEPTEMGLFSDWDLVYRLGPERGFIRIDYEWLLIQLDRDGRVAACRLDTD
jgi:hypothetical protein